MLPYLPSTCPPDMRAKGFLSLGRRLQASLFFPLSRLPSHPDLSAQGDTVQPELYAPCASVPPPLSAMTSSKYIVAPPWVGVLKKSPETTRRLRRNGTILLVYRILYWNNLWPIFTEQRIFYSRSAVCVILCIL